MSQGPVCLTGGDCADAGPATVNVTPTIASAVAARLTCLGAQPLGLLLRQMTAAPFPRSTGKLLITRPPPPNACRRWMLTFTPVDCQAPEAARPGLIDRCSPARAGPVPSRQGSPGSRGRRA